MIKQDVYIYVAYSRPNGWTDWAEFFADTHGWPGGVKTQNEDTNRCRRPVYTISVYDCTELLLKQKNRKNTHLTFFGKLILAEQLNPNYNNIWESCVSALILQLFFLFTQQYFSKVNKYFLFCLIFFGLSSSFTVL